MDKKVAREEKKVAKGGERVCEKYKLREERRKEKVDIRLPVLPDNLELSFESNKLIRYT